MAKYTMDMSEEFDRLLSDLAKKSRTTKAQVVRQAVALFKLVKEETERGKKIAITNQSDQVEKEIVTTP